MEKVKVILPKHLVKSYEEVAKELAQSHGWTIERINKKEGETYFLDEDGVRCVWYRGDDAYECDKDGIPVSDDCRHYFDLVGDMDWISVVWGVNVEGEVVAVVP